MRKSGSLRIAKIEPCTAKAIDTLSARPPLRGQGRELIFDRRCWGWSALGRCRLRSRDCKGFNGQSDAFRLCIDAQNLHLNNLASLDRFGRILDESIREFADMHKPVLMDADVDECPELCHIRNNALQHYANLHFIDSADLIVELRRNKLVAWIATGLAQFRMSSRVYAPTERFVRSTFSNSCGC